MTCERIYNSVKNPAHPLSPYGDRKLGLFEGLLWLSSRVDHTPHQMKMTFISF